MRVKDKVAVVVGSTSGIGRACAELLAKEGASVVVSGRRPEKGEEVVQSIQSAGGKAVFVQTDVSNENQIKHLMDTAVNEYGKIDILVNCAGGAKTGMLHTLTSDDWDWTLALDGKSVFLSMKYALGYMIKQKSGSIINISSTSINHTMPYTSLYNFSKSGVNAMSKVVAAEYASLGIRCNIVAPGYTDTEIIAHMSEEQKKHIRSEIPMGRFAEPEEIANAVLFLASSESSYCSGQIIDVNGAWAI